MKKRSVLLGVVPLALVLVAGACDDAESPAPAASSEAGAEAAASAPDSAADAIVDAAPTCDTLPGSFGSKSCNDCMKTSCCSVITECEGDSACKAMQACTLGCIGKPDGGACYKDCESANSAAKATWKKVNDCWLSDPPGCGVACT